jgi:hypothetical protein
MVIVKFIDGSARHFEIHGEGFEVRDGEDLLFEFPNGEILMGTVHIIPEGDESPPDVVYHGNYDSESNRVDVKG